MDQERNEVTAAAGNEPREIRGGIARTRVEMSETIGEIQERLRPEHLLQQAKDNVKDAATTKVRNIMHSASERAQTIADRTETAGRGTADYARSHPAQMALVAGGLTWWLLNRSNRTEMWRSPSSRPWNPPADRFYDDEGRLPGQGASGSRLADTAGEYVATAREAAGEFVESARETAGEYAASARETAGELADSARTGARRAAERIREAASDTSVQARQGWRSASTSLDEWMQQNPLAAGAVAVAVGAAIGLSAPRTQLENRTLGETRDQAMEAASRKAREVTDDVSHKVEKAIDTFTEATPPTPANTSLS